LLANTDLHTKERYWNCKLTSFVPYRAANNLSPLRQVRCISQTAVNAKILPGMKRQKQLLPKASAPVAVGRSVTSSHSSAMIAIITWSACSATLILYNKYVLHGMKFHFPLFVTLIHCLGVSFSLFVASTCFNAFEPPHQMNSFLPLVRSMMPISIIFTIATVMRNFAFIYLPVPTIQIINSSAPAVSYFISCLVGIEKFSLKIALAVGGISAGVCLSAATAMRFTSIVGAALLFGGLVLEATRGVLLKRLLNNNVSVSPLGLLFLSSTMSFLLLVGPVGLKEASDAFSVMQASGLPLLFLLAGNVFFAICLNFASFNFLKTCSVTTTSITAVSKDCALFFISSYVLQGSHFSSSSLSSHSSFFSSVRRGEWNLGGVGYSVSIIATLIYIRLRQGGSS